jgi:hypothetical protein
MRLVANFSASDENIHFLSQLQMEIANETVSYTNHKERGFSWHCKASLYQVEEPLRLVQMFPWC